MLCIATAAPDRDPNAATPRSGLKCRSAVDAALQGGGILPCEMRNGHSITKVPACRGSYMAANAETNTNRDRVPCPRNTVGMPQRGILIGLQSHGESRKPISRVHSKTRAAAGGISAERTEFQIIPLIAGSPGKGPASKSLLYRHTCNTLTTDHCTLPYAMHCMLYPQYIKCVEAGE